jgi:TolB protein
VRVNCSSALLLLAVNVLVWVLLLFPTLQKRFQGISLRSSPTPTATQSPLTTLPYSPTLTPTVEEPLPITASFTPLPPSPATPTPLPPSPIPTITLKEGLLFLSLREGNYYHLFAYQPEDMPFTRLTSGPWDDITPALSPDGERLAFASNRNGYWDLYTLKLTDGTVTRLTDTLEYEAAPSWSPDGIWIVYESYIEENLEILICSTTEEMDPIRLTDNAATDYSPAWSPQAGRKIAFVSTRSGDADIWIADLDQPDETRFVNVSQDALVKESNPAWSPDGSLLAWSAVRDGYHNLVVWDSNHPAEALRLLGSGDQPVWSPDGNTLLALLSAPNQVYFTAYRLSTPGLAVAPMNLPGAVDGIVWGNALLPRPLPAVFRESVLITPAPLWTPIATPTPGGTETPVVIDRQNLVALPVGVQAPYPMLAEGVDGSFLALRNRLTIALGWDFLSTLDNAYIPLTTRLDPGMGADWLYTGRAIAVTTLPANAGWMVIVREDLGPDIYWRVYLRARFQDGSAGRPLHDQPWDFNARSSGDTAAYEKGGDLFPVVPPGYWIDFTQLAAAYGWERLPALSTWRAAYTAARFNEFIHTDSMDWRTAMLELYPPEALVTPTQVVPPTITPTRTPRWYQTPTPTRTLTPRPTLTPITPTPTDTLTPTVSQTPTASPTATRSPTVTRTPTRTPVFTKSPTHYPSVTPTP